MNKKIDQIISEIKNFGLEDIANSVISSLNTEVTSGAKDRYSELLKNIKDIAKDTGKTEEEILEDLEKLIK
jgi:nucleosome binding factor SPN SPT16 subunit